ncbi:probable polygalacturonase [Tanacetum coccineum]
MKLIVMDEHATVRMGLINRFKNQLEEGNSVTLQTYSLGEIQPKFRMVNKALCLSFLSNIEVETCPDSNGSYHGVVGQVVSCEDLDNYKKWLNDFLNTCGDHGKIILVFQLAMMKFWDGGVSNVTAENCLVWSSRRGVRIKTSPDINLGQHSELPDEGYDPKALPILKDISFTGVYGQGVRVPVRINGSEEIPVRNVIFQDMSVGINYKKKTYLTVCFCSRLCKWLYLSFTMRELGSV